MVSFQAPLCTCRATPARFSFPVSKEKELSPSPALILLLAAPKQTRAAQFSC